MLTLFVYLMYFDLLLCILMFCYYIYLMYLTGIKHLNLNFL